MVWTQKLSELLRRLWSGRPAVLSCPVCSAALRQTEDGQYGSVVLDVCPRCEGTWFDAGGLDRLDGSIWANVEEHAFHPVAGDRREALCARCRVPLDAVQPFGAEFIIERCYSCRGFWLDGTEREGIRTLARALDATPLSHPGGDQKPPGWSDLRWQIHRRKTTQAAAAEQPLDPSRETSA